jgi:hypothetical protein
VGNFANAIPVRGEEGLGVCTAEALVVRKIPFREDQQLQVFDFIEAKFAILMVF